MVDSFCESTGHRPTTLEDLYVWVLEGEGATADDARVADLADWMSYFEVEPNSLLAVVNVVADRAPIARRLVAARDIAVVRGVRG